MRNVLLLAFCAAIFAGCTDSRQVRDWPDIPNELLGPGVTEKLKTRWMSGRAAYIITITPASDLLKEKRSAYGLGPTFTVSFTDDTKFVVLKDTFYLRQMTAVVNDSGTPIWFEYQGEIICNRSVYRSLEGWALGWSLN